jgi:putative ATPase
MEDGTILLVGATTENPSFELNAALLSPRAGDRAGTADAGRSGALAQRAEKELGRALPLTGRARGAAGDGRWRRARAC